MQDPEIFHISEGTVVTVEQKDLKLKIILKLIESFFECKYGLKAMSQAAGLATQHLLAATGYLQCVYAAVTHVARCLLP